MLRLSENDKHYTNDHGVTFAYYRTAAGFRFVNVNEPDLSYADTIMSRDEADLFRWLDSIHY